MNEDRQPGSRRFHTPEAVIAHLEAIGSLPKSGPRRTPADDPDPGGTFERYALNSRTDTELRGVLHSDASTEHRKQALEILVARHGDGVVSDVVAITRDPSWSMRNGAVHMLRYLSGKRALAALIEALSDADDWVASAAAEGLVSYPLELVRWPLRRALACASLRVRAQAALTLAELGDEHPKVRATLAEAIAEWGSTDPPLEARIIRKHSSDDDYETHPLE